MNKVLLFLLKITVFTTVIAFSTFSATAQVLDGLSSASQTPTLAYSLRKLKAAYAGPAVRVRNANNTDSVDVYFDSNGLVSLSSPVSASLTSVAVGASTANTLTTWAGSGTAFITRWFDQSGNNRPAYNSNKVQLGTAIQANSTTLTTNGTSVTLGTAMTTFAFTDYAANAATSNNSLSVTSPADVRKMAITGTGIANGTFAQTYSATTITTTKAVNMLNGGAFRAYATGNTYQPGNMLVASDGTLIGIIKSIESSTSLTLIAAAPTNKTYLTSEWGLATQPTLVKDGVIEFIPGTAMPAMRVYNGTNSNTRFKVPNYINDAVGGASINLAGVQNVNLFTVARVEGNFGVTNGQVLFGTYSASPTANKLIFMYGFSSTFAGYYRSYSSTAISSPNSPIGVVTAVGRLKITSDGTNANTIGSMYNSANATAPTPVAAVLPAAIDATQIQLLGQNNGFGNRNFEGLASELIFYGSTSNSATKWDETDAVALYNNESLAFITGPTVIDPTVTSVAATSATIGANVAAAGASVVSARGTYYGTAVNPVGNGAPTAGTTGTFTRDIIGLTTNTKYYYRGYASNTAGTNYSVDGSFTTLPAMPTADAPSDISSTGFTAHWTAPVQGAETYTYRFHYTTSAAWSGGTSTPGIVSSDVSRVISGLTPNTVYYYRLRAENTSGGGMYSNPGQSLTTLPAAPTIATASAVTASGFTANWTAPTQGAETFTYTVEYGTAADLAGATAVDGITSANLNNVITGLSGSTTYYYRVKAVNTQGAGAWSDIQSVQTYTAATDKFRSLISGNWGTPATWQSSFDNTNWMTATSAPTSSAASITIQNGHEVNVFDANATASALTVQGGGKLTLTSPYTLSATSLALQSHVTNGTATVKDLNANGGLTVSGTTTVNQYLTAGRNWYVASPSSATALPAVSTGTISLYGYSEVAVTDAAGATGWQSNPSTFDTGVTGNGYVASVSADGNITFTGTLNTGAKNITLTSRTGTANKAGFNLIGNPYSSYLDWSLVAANTANAALLRSNTMWYRTKMLNSQSQLVYSFWTVNGDGIGVPNGASTQIPPMQSFWVRAVEGGGSLALTNAMCSHAPATDKLLKAPAAKNADRALIRLQVSNGVNTDETLLYTSTNALNGLDSYDAPKMSEGNAAIPEIYSTANGNNEHLVINGMNSIPLDTEIPLGFTTGQSNSFTLKATEITNFAAGTKVFLKDKQAVAEQELTVDAPYSFTSGVVTGADRFSLIFRAQGVNTQVAQPAELPTAWVYRNENNGIAIHCNKTLCAAAQVEVYNALGQKLISQGLTSTVTVLNTSLASGVYVVTVRSAGKSTTQKVILN